MLCKSSDKGRQRTLEFSPTGKVLVSYQAPLADSYRMVLRNLLSLRLHSRQQNYGLNGSLFPLCLRAPHLPLADSYRMVLRNQLSLRLH